MDAAGTDSWPGLDEVPLPAGVLARARRFHLERDRRRYLGRHRLLHHLLGLYLDRDPGEVEIHYLAKGKPVLRQAGGESIPARAVGRGLLHFNLSHSEGVALIALTRIGPIGVDLEAITPLDGLDDLAERHFSPTELADLRATPAEDRLAAFYRCWTRKEAFVKATGEGLNRPLQSISVTLLAGEVARLRSLAHDPESAARWTICDPGPPAPGFVAAMALEGSVRRVDCWNWHGPR